MVAAVGFRNGGLIGSVTWSIFSRKKSTEVSEHMKRRIVLSIAMFLVIASFAMSSSDATVSAARNSLTRFDTGVITLGADQLLRINVNGSAGNDTINVQTTRQVYGQPVCNAGVCQSFLIIVEALPVMTVESSEMLTFNVVPTTSSGGVRALVTANDPFADVTAHVVDANTGKTQIILDIMGY